MEQLAEHHGQRLRSLFKFAQGAAHLWDVHEIGLAKKERELQERLEDCRHDHDNQNQVGGTFLLCAQVYMAQFHKACKHTTCLAQTNLA